jgi:thiosulfate/3-mercaptopyruvate sulfurtransferase
VSDATRDELASRLADEGLVVLDVRSAAEFHGETGYPCDPRQGHLPGARHLDLRDLQAATSLAEVVTLVGVPEGSEVVAYCHSGSRSAMAVELLRAAGYEARNYAGSWHEWAADAALPVDSP